MHSPWDSIVAWWLRLSLVVYHYGPCMGQWVTVFGTKLYKKEAKRERLALKEYKQFLFTFASTSRMDAVRRNLKITKICVHMNIIFNAIFVYIKYSLSYRVIRKKDYCTSRLQNLFKWEFHLNIRNLFKWEFRLKIKLPQRFTSSEVCSSGRHNVKN